MSKPKVFQHTKDLINKQGLYSEMKMCPLKYNGYRRTQRMIDFVKEEIYYELSVYPDRADILLDHINNLNKLVPEPE